jgi:hypothetical protein
LAIFAVACFVSPNFHSTSGLGPYGGDFLQEWVGGYIVRTGQGARLYDHAFTQQLQHDATLIGFALDEERYFPFVYPPFYYVLVSPFSLLPFHAAAVMWVGVMVLFLCATQVLLARTLTGRTSRITWLWPCVAFFAPLLQNVVSGQKGTILLFLFSATYALLRSGRSFTAGAVFGLLAFKPQVAIVIGAAMLWKRQWRFVAGSATTVLALLVVSLTVGIDACRDYVAFLTGTSDYLRTAGYDLTKAHCWYGFFHLLLTSDTTIRLATLLANAVTIGAIVCLMSGPLQPRSSRFVWQYSALVVASLLVSPHLLTYDLTVLLLPALLLCESPKSQVIAAIMLLACVVSTPLAQVLGVQLSVLAMFGALVRLATCRNEPLAVVQ